MAVAGPEVRNKVGTLKGDTGNDYETLIQGLKEDLLRDKLLIFLISQAMDMKQDEHEGIDDFAMRARMKHERINWDTIKDKYDLNHLMIGVTITRGTKMLTFVNIVYRDVAPPTSPTFAVKSSCGKYSYRF